MTREEARKLLDEWVESDTLKRHMRAVAVCMEAYARKFGEDPDLWYVTGLLHDLDYEKHPDEHPDRAVSFLKGRLPEEAVEAIWAHARPDRPRNTLLARTLVAVDELTGFLIAVALVQPGQSFQEITKWKSIRKKWKDRAFARGVDREEVEHAVEALGVDFQEHVLFMLEALKAREDEVWNETGRGA